MPPPDSAATTAGLVPTSFSLYPADLEIVASVKDLFTRRGYGIDDTKTIRGLYHVATELDLFAFAVVQHRLDELKPGRREPLPVSWRNQIWVPQADTEKFARVVQRLKQADIKSNESYVFRGYLRHRPANEELIPPFEEFLKKFPDFRYKEGRILAGRSKPDGAS